MKKGKMIDSDSIQNQTLSESKTTQILSLLDASFQNIPTPQDQEVIDPKHPSAVSEVHNFPTVPLFNRKENFSKFNLETLFFAFYHQQGTYQQYLAAVELKRKNWKFNKKFETWFKKADGNVSQLEGVSKLLGLGDNAYFI